MHANKHQKKKTSAYVRGIRTPVKLSLISAFLKHVQSTPSLAAIMTSDISWTYQELFDDVLVCKRYLEVLDTHTPIMLCLHRTPRLLSILLALQWLEMAYIPVEPQTPLGRVRAMIDDSQAEVLFYDTIHHEACASLPCKVLALDELEQAVNLEPCALDKIPYASNPKAIAYVIYTSGSTGTPKGVRVSRGALDNFLTSMSHYFLTEEDAILLATTTFTFDISALELFLPIWQHKTLFLGNES